MDSAVPVLRMANCRHRTMTVGGVYGCRSAYLMSCRYATCTYLVEHVEGDLGCHLHYHAAVWNYHHLHKKKHTVMEWEWMKRTRRTSDGGESGVSRVLAGLAAVRSCEERQPRMHVPSPHPVNSNGTTTFFITGTTITTSPTTSGSCIHRTTRPPLIAIITRA